MAQSKRHRAWIFEGSINSSILTVINEFLSIITSDYHQNTPIACESNTYKTEKVQYLVPTASRVDKGKV